MNKIVWVDGGIRRIARWIESANVVPSKWPSGLLCLPASTMKHFDRSSPFKGNISPRWDFFFQVCSASIVSMLLKIGYMDFVFDNPTVLQVL